jgi:hypothetical protein
MLSPTVNFAYRSAEVIDPARGSVRLLGVTLADTNDPGRGTIEELTLADLRDDGVGEVTARGVEVTGADGGFTAARLQVLGLTVRKPAPGESPDPRMASFDAVRLERVTLTGEAQGTLDSLAVEEYGPGRLTRIDLAGLDMRLSSGSQLDRFRLGRFVMRGMDIASIAGAIAAKEQPPRTPGRQAIEMEDLAFGMGGRIVSAIGSVRATGETSDGVSGTGNIAIRGIRVEPLPELDEWLRRFGYEALNLEMTMDGRYDAATGRVDIASIALAGREIGALSIGLVLDGVTQEAAEAADLTRMTLVSASIRYVDQSLFGRFLRDQARQTRASEAQLREQYAALAGGALTQPGAAVLDPIRDAVQRFIRGQAREVEISLRPPQPIAFSTLQSAPPKSPVEAQRMLGLSATAR